MLELKNDCMTIIDKLDERNGGDEMGVIASVPTLAEIVAQLDRLFDDVKNLVADSENNVMARGYRRSRRQSYVAEQGKRRGSKIRP